MLGGTLGLAFLRVAITYVNEDARGLALGFSQEPRPGRELTMREHWKCTVAPQICQVHSPGRGMPAREAEYRAHAARAGECLVSVRRMMR